MALPMVVGTLSRCLLCCSCFLMWVISPTGCLGLGADQMLRSIAAIHVSRSAQYGLDS